MNHNEDFSADQRKEAIIELLNQKGKVRVPELSELLKASEVTIRSDLTALEKTGLLERVHGGAIKMAKKYYNMSFVERQSENTAEKKAIAAAAAEMINDGEVIFLNSGTTTYFIACELKNKKNLNIVTNSLNITLELLQTTDHNVVTLGGNMNLKYSFTYGEDAINQLKNYRADKLFLCVDGIDAESGITTYHSMETDVNRCMIERSNATIVVADYMKIGRESFRHTGDIGDVDILITNRKSDEVELDALRRLGIEICTVGV